MKGIILSGGSGTRLHPVTRGVSKQMLPVYDKPMIYYPLSSLLLAGIKDILIISTPQDTPRFEQLLGDGSDWGIKLNYAIQEHPNGLAEALLIAEEYLAGSSCALILGDNVFYGQDLVKQLEAASEREKGATVFAYRVSDPERYGIVEFDGNGRAVDLVEKPENPRSNYAVTGLYFYDNKAVEYAKAISPSDRGELEITDVNKLYLDAGHLHVEVMGRGCAWLDMGTHDSLLDASHFISTVEKRQGLKIACLEEIAYRKGYIDRTQLLAMAEALSKTNYGQYLMQIANDL